MPDLHTKRAAYLAAALDIFTILYLSGLVFLSFHFFFIKFPVPCRRHSDNFRENSAEIVRIIVSHDRSDPCDRMIGGDQKGLGMSDPSVDHVLDRCPAGCLLEYVGDVCRRTS